MKLKASLLYKSNCTLGEGATWHAGRESFFWVDIEGRIVYEYNWPLQKTKQWNLSHRISFIQETGGDRMLVALQGGIAWMDLITGQLEWILEVERDIGSNRTNDGACDTEGRLWIGTMDLQCRPGRGNLYCIDKNYRMVLKLSGLTIPNGIAWSQNNDRMYHVDTGDQCVRSYFFDGATGEIRFEKIAIQVPTRMGSPDGMCMDEEGMLWIAHWGGFGVYRWDPANGRLLDKYELPVAQVTSCAFGGEHMDQLLITTANQGLLTRELEIFPESGDVFIAQPGIKGIRQNRFLTGHP